MKLVSSIEASINRFRSFSEPYPFARTITPQPLQPPPTPASFPTPSPPPPITSTLPLANNPTTNLLPHSPRPFNEASLAPNDSLNEAPKPYILPSEALSPNTSEAIDGASLEALRVLLASYEALTRSVLLKTFNSLALVSPKAASSPDSSGPSYVNSLKAVSGPMGEERASKDTNQTPTSLKAVSSPISNEGSYVMTPRALSGPMGNEETSTDSSQIHIPLEAVSSPLLSEASYVSFPKTLSRPSRKEEASEDSSQTPTPVDHPRETSYPSSPKALSGSNRNEENSEDSSQTPTPLDRLREASSTPTTALETLMNTSEIIEAALRNRTLQKPSPVRLPKREASVRPSAPNEALTKTTQSPEATLRTLTLQESSPDPRMLTKSFNKHYEAHKRIQPLPEALMQALNQSRSSTPQVHHESLWKLSKTSEPLMKLVTYPPPPPARELHTRTTSRTTPLPAPLLSFITARPLNKVQLNDSTTSLKPLRSHDDPTKLRTLHDTSMTPDGGLEQPLSTLNSSGLISRATTRNETLTNTLNASEISTRLHLTIQSPYYDNSPPPSSPPPPRTPFLSPTMSSELPKKPHSIREALLKPRTQNEPLNKTTPSPFEALEPTTLASEATLTLHTEPGKKTTVRTPTEPLNETVNEPPPRRVRHQEPFWGEEKSREKEGKKKSKNVPWYMDSVSIPLPVIILIGVVFCLLMLVLCAS
ncbi:uncharacterized protein LOC127008447 [Eriocheir sinensis]|uniref:uncharacterized protein LOC127008447 n=1 Tax=Eriocheir sinensis TaxID=95602 RepID=UPI0021C947B9|nr:uncharacterized protein LOC127008447 [Eriocheir sinensis]